MSLDERFREIADKLKAKKPLSAKSHIEEIYGLYKQATVGDINIDKPVTNDKDGKQKFEAWSKKKGMTQDQAKEAYIALVTKLL